MGNSKRIKVVIAGGGTGGHLYPGIALAQEFEKRGNAEILFVGTSYGIENKILPKMNYQLKKIWMRGLQRKVSFSNLLFPVRLAVSLAQCAILFAAFRPHVIIGTGGYVSGPALMIGLVFGIPTMIQEQNSYPGLVNRLLGNRVGQVHLTFEDSEKYFKKQHNLFISGNPVRGDLNQIGKKTGLEKFGLNKNKTTLLIFGGSQGSHAINMEILNSIDPLMGLSNLQILWATGEQDYSDVKNKCANYSDRIALRPFIEDMAAAYAAADLAICRAGATTLAEIAICGLPSILVPYPFAAEGHQEFNAKSLEHSGAAVMLREQSMHAQLVQTLAELIADENKRKAMSIAAQKFARPNAAQKIVDAAEKMLG